MTQTADPYASVARPHDTDPYASVARTVTPVKAVAPPDDPYASVARRPAAPAEPKPATVPVRNPQKATGQVSKVTPTIQQTHGDGPIPTAFHAVTSAFTNFAAEAQARLKETAANTLAGANNIEQTPARVMATLLNHGIHAETLKHAFHNAFDTGEGGAEVDKVNAAITAHMPKTDNPIGKFAEGLAASFISDPVTLLPVVGWLGKTATAAKALTAISDGARAVAGARAAASVGRAAGQMRDVHAHMTGEVAKIIKPVFGGRQELDPLLEPHAKAAHLGFEHREISRMQGELGEPDMHLLEQNKAGLKNVKHKGGAYDLPEPVKQRYLQEPWRYGTPEMRAQAEKLGYKPVESDKPWATKPESVLDYNLREDYQFLGTVSDLTSSPAFKKYGGKSLGEATFEKERTGNFKGLDADQFDRVAARLRLGRDQIRRSRAQAATSDYVRHFGGWKGPTKLEFPEGEGPGRPVPEGIDKLSTDPVRFGGPGRWLSSMAGRAVQGSVFPHAINNVGTLSFLQSPTGVGRAIGYMAKDAKTGGKALSAEQTQRIQDIGAMVDYGHQPPGSVWTKVLSGGPVGEKVLAGSQKLLTKMEMAYRQGLLDELDRTMGPSKSMRDEMTKGQMIRDAVVDYRNVPLVIAAMEAAGAPFSPFLAGLTHAVGKAVVRHPERVAAVQKVENHAQDDLGVTIPNPVNTFEAWMNPIKQLVNRGGPIVGGAASLQSPFIDTPEEIGGGMAERFAGPWLSQIPGFFNLPFPEKGTDPGTFSPEQGLIHFLTGAYPYSGPAGAYQIKGIERQKGRAEE